jgi:hypothetical protein
MAAAQPARADSGLSGTATADDDFFAWVSTNPGTLGTAVGSGSNWGTSYPVSLSTLAPGTYYLQIEAIDQYGAPGGFSGVFNLSGDGLFANGTPTLTTDASNLAYWLGSYNNSNSSDAIQTWVVPTGSVVQATYPWGNIAGTPSWIWPSDPSSSPPAGGQCPFCTVDFMATFTVGQPESGVPEPSTWAMMLLGLLGVGGALRRRRRQLATS